MRIASLVPAASVLDKPAEVRVGFCADNSCLSKCIGYSSLAGWAHMTSIISPTEVIDARVWATKAADGPPIPAGVRLRPVEYLDANPYYVEVAIACTPLQRINWITALRSQLGEPYDKPGIIDFLTGRTVDPTYRGEKHPWFCNELGIWALQEAGIVRRLIAPPYRRTPGGALDVCLATADSRITRYRGERVRQAIVSAGFDLAAIHP